MTYSEKAKEIYSKMKPSVIDDDSHEQQWWHSFARSRAIICVDEILNNLKTLLVSLEFQDGTTHLKYWQQVKEEIQSL